MKEQHGLRVQEDGVDVLMGAGRVLGGRGHLERSEEARDENLQLLHVLLLSLHHAEHQTREVSSFLLFHETSISFNLHPPVSFPHALCVWRPNVIFHNLFPPSSKNTQKIFLKTNFNI